MAILTAMNSEEVDIIGLTTVFGNVYTPTATRNAFKLLEIAGRTQVLNRMSECCLWLLASACVPHEQTHGMSVRAQCHKASSSLLSLVCMFKWLLCRYLWQRVPRGPLQALRRTGSQTLYTEMTALAT